jgi:hypothetical protein
MRILASLALGLLSLNPPAKACCLCPDDESSEGVQLPTKVRSTQTKKKQSAKEEVIILGNGLEEGFIVAIRDKNGVISFPDPPDIVSVFKGFWK